MTEHFDPKKDIIIKIEGGAVVDCYFPNKEQRYILLDVDTMKERGEWHDQCAKEADEFLQNAADKDRNSAFNDALVASHPPTEFELNPIKSVGVSTKGYTFNALLYADTRRDNKHGYQFELIYCEDDNTLPVDELVPHNITNLNYITSNIIAPILEKYNDVGIFFRMDDQTELVRCTKGEGMALLVYAVEQLLKDYFIKELLEAIVEDKKEGQFNLLETERDD